MEELLVALAVMTAIMLVMMLQRGRQGSLDKRAKLDCWRRTRHALRVHTYDGRGDVIHRCRCGLHSRRGVEGGWCRICADPQLERQALQSFIRRRA